MKKNTCVGVALVVGCLALVPQSVGAEEVKSLRGTAEIEAPSLTPEVEKLIPDQKPIKRDFVQQPPLIPHKIDGYTTNATYNKCLSCHSWANYKLANATKISPAHFVDRNGNELASLAPRRYFCTQCHVVQTDAEPLVENTFKSVPALQK